MFVREFGFGVPAVNAGTFGVYVERSARHHIVLMQALLMRHALGRAPALASPGMHCYKMAEHLLTPSRFHSTTSLGPGVCLHL